MSPETSKEAERIFSAIAAGAGKTKNTSVVICPPFVFVPELIALAGKKKIAIGAQDVFPEGGGSYTGAVSVKMLASLGVRYVIVGHSERRQLGETDEMVNKKAALVLKNGMKPIICIGEGKRDEEGHYLSAIRSQIEKALKGITKRDFSSIVIAYEPIFAIGAAEALGAREVHQMAIFIKKTIVDIYKLKTPAAIEILYGGAVNPDNAKAIISEGGIDGLLIGRQSLMPENFIKILLSAGS